MDRSLHLANEKGLETARTVVPLQSLPIPVPQLEAVFFLTVLVSVTKCNLWIYGVFFSSSSRIVLSSINLVFRYARSRKIAKVLVEGGWGGEGGRWEFFFNSLNRGGIPEIIRLAYVPIFKSDRPAIGHPEESAFLGLVGTGGPKVLVSKAKILNVLLQSVVLLLRRYTRQMHPVISAILRRSVPIGLQRIK